ncbi:MAG: rRNA maturation RNase YbeY [Chitinophagales bacterium]|nr:rRNA maturation RNase YbeY [Chitinophagales bacterium]
MAISFNFVNSLFYIPKKKTCEWLILVCYLEHAEIETLDYVFCSDEYILNLNSRYLNHKFYTDILTFDYSENHRITAEIYISVDRIKDNASKFKNTFQQELKRVMIHGLLHTLGYKDKSVVLKRLMRKKEDDCLLLFDNMKHVSRETAPIYNKC